MPNKHIPQRRCVACLESKDKAELVRITLNGDSLNADFTGNAPGRGSYICKKEECLALAEKKNAFARSYRRAINPEETKKVIEIIRETLA